MGVFKPNPKYALVVQVSTTIPSEPKSIKLALAHLGWKATMVEELDAFT